MFVLLKGKNILIFFAAATVLIFLSFRFINYSAPVSSNQSNIIVVDPGHGGVDGGAVGLYNIIEKDINLKIAKKVEAILKEKGFSVIMTRNEDISIHDKNKETIRAQKTSDLLNRAKLANESGARLYVSLHLNTYEKESVSGAQVFFNKNDTTGNEYATKIMTELKKLDTKNTKTEKTLPNPNLLFKNLKIPAVLVECGFISNNNDALLLKSDDYQQKLAIAIVNGVLGN